MIIFCRLVFVLSCFISLHRIRATDCPFAQWQQSLGTLIDATNQAGPLLKHLNQVSTTNHIPPDVYGEFRPSQGVNEALECHIPTNCSDGIKYRTMDGSCNNLIRPANGMTNSRYARLLPPKYDEESFGPPLSVMGTPLPNARELSMMVWGDKSVPDKKHTLLMMQFGQLAAHEISLFSTRGAPTDCCTQPHHKRCMPIPLYPRDPIRYGSGKTCIHVARAISDIEADCHNASSDPIYAEKISVVNAYLDLSAVYGNSLKQSKKVRLFRGGLLKTTSIRNRPWPPITFNVNGECTADNYQCFILPDSRNQFTPTVLVCHTLFLREHNRIAAILAQINPQLNDEQLYQEARRINIAQFQKIVYYDYLPLLVGPAYAYSNHLIHNTHIQDYVNDYDPSVKAAPIAEFAGAAFRYLHNQIPGEFTLVDQDRITNQTLRLSDYFGRSENINFLSHQDNFDAIIRGMTTKPQKRADANIDSEIKYFFNRKPFQDYGVDLKAIDIQRGRDFALPSYNDIREYCGLHRANDWNGFLKELSIEKISILQQFYATPDDVELNVGGSLESHTAGLVGPSFQCIIGQQFLRLRMGDRFFFEHEDARSGFNKAQLAEIRKASIAGILCNNADYLREIQPNGFLIPTELNPLTCCESIKQPDLIRWAV